MKRIFPAALICLCTALAASPASAQMMGGSGSAVSLRPKAEDTAGAARQAPPPALPGAQSQGTAAPATKAAGDMAPNEALFDAINRGDITAARDALSRGAELNAQNILGMTPMELSVDLGRNDIAFLLLSMRGETPRRGKAVSQSDAGGQSIAAKPSTRKAVPLKVAAGPGNRTDQAPRLFANDGGTPVPSAGFLGFDTGRTLR